MSTRPSNFMSFGSTKYFGGALSTTRIASRAAETTEPCHAAPHREV
jgi:hypothetical protein